MTTQRISWKLSTAPNVIGYELLFSDTGIAGDYSVLGTVLHQIPGPNYDEGTASFFYDDSEVSYRWYRLRVVDQFGNKTEDTFPTPFQAGNAPTEVPTLHFVKLDHNFNLPNNYQYVTIDGDPIDQATVRVYKKTEWDAGNATVVVGITKTDDNGQWRVPVPVEPGYTYTLVYHKENEFGPDVVEVTV